MFFDKHHSFRVISSLMPMAAAMATRVNILGLNGFVVLWLFSSLEM